jgi:hypothetical protein
MWMPSKELESFLGEGDAPVYMGFGSMPLRNATVRNTGHDTHATRQRKADARLCRPGTGAGLL